MKSIFVVIPVRNEERAITPILQKIINLKIPNIHIIPVIDRYSKDGTQKIIERMQRHLPVNLLYHTNSTGVVSSYLYGLKHSLVHGADYIVEMDAGGSHDPSVIPKFIDALDNGYDCAFASRFMKGGRIENHPLSRRILSRYGTLLANLVLGTKLTDMTSGYKAIKRDVLEAMDLDDFLSIGTSYIYQTEMHYYCSRLNICEIPIVYVGSYSEFKFSSVPKCLKILFALKKRTPIVKKTVSYPCR